MEGHSIKLSPILIPAFAINPATSGLPVIMPPEAKAPGIKK